MNFKFRNAFLAVGLLVSMLISLTSCGGRSNSNWDIFDEFTDDMTAEDVKKALGEPFEEKNGDLYYQNIELCKSCGLSGDLEINFLSSDKTIYFVEWNFDTGNQMVDDYADQTQAIYDHFTTKFGEAEPDGNSYEWYETDNKGPAGSPRYRLSLDTWNLIRVFKDFEG